MKINLNFFSSLQLCANPELWQFHIFGNGEFNLKISHVQEKFNYNFNIRVHFNDLNIPLIKSSLDFIQVSKLELYEREETDYCPIG